MKSLLAIAVALATLAAAQAASAHTADKGEAALISRIELSEYADYRCSLRASCDFASYPEMTKYDCVWTSRSRHGVRCWGNVDLHGHDYIDDRYCMASVTVSFWRGPRVRGWECL